MKYTTSEAIRTLIFFVLLLCCGGTFAQSGCDNAAYNEVIIHANSQDAQPAVCRRYLVGGTVEFTFATVFSGSMSVDFGEPNSNGPRLVSEGETVTINYGNITVPTERFLNFLDLTDPQGGTITASVVLKPAASGANYFPPDEVWSISSDQTFDPPVPGAFPTGSPFLNSTVTASHAYVKYHPSHNNQLIKPLNKAEITSGLLFSKAIPLVEPTDYGGSTPPKTLTFTPKTQHRRTWPQPSPLASRCGLPPSPFLERGRG